MLYGLPVNQPSPTHCRGSFDRPRKRLRPARPGGYQYFWGQVCPKIFNCLQYWIYIYIHYYIYIYIILYYILYIYEPVMDLKFKACLCKAVSFLSVRNKWGFTATIHRPFTMKPEQPLVPPCSWMPMGRCHMLFPDMIWLHAAKSCAGVACMHLLPSAFLTAKLCQAGKAGHSIVALSESLLFRFCSSDVLSNSVRSNFALTLPSSAIGRTIFLFGKLWEYETAAIHSFSQTGSQDARFGSRSWREIGWTCLKNEHDWYDTNMSW